MDRYWLRQYGLDTPYLETFARVAAEAAAVRVVGAAEGLLSDGVFARAVVAVHGVPDHQAPSGDVAIVVNAIASGTGFTTRLVGVTIDIFAAVLFGYLI